jgi:Ser/Thr protein kinase RdoA (MazF antagonist)
LGYPAGMRYPLARSDVHPVEIVSSLPDLDILLKTYNLPPGFYMEQVEANRYTVSTSHGQFLLRIYPVGTSLEAQRYQHWLLTALQTRLRNFALPTPLRTSDGATFYTASNGATWVLVRHLQGTPLQANEVDQAYAAGNALALIHTALAQFQSLPNPAYPGYDLYNRSLPHTRGTPPNHPADLGLQNTREANHRLQRFIELVRLHQQPPPMPNIHINWHLVQGMFAPDNLLYDGERVIGVLDFGYAHPDYRVREFAHALMAIASDLSPLFWGIARAFVDGYSELLRLTRYEIALVPEFIVAQQVEQVMEYYRAGQPVHAAEALRFQEEISTWLEVEQSRLLAMLRGQFLGE